MTLNKQFTNHKRWYQQSSKHSINNNY